MDRYDIPINECKRRYQYCPDTGILMSRMYKRPVGNLRDDGYVQVNINGKLYLAHRVIWFMYYGEQPPRQIDHVDQNRANNRIDNLRDGVAINVHNRKTNHNNILGIRNVSEYNHNGYLARKVVNGKVYMKHGASPEQALEQLRKAIPKEHVHLLDEGVPREQN